jgi:UDP-N-acetylglucosamine 2-epimerase (non-hydrolysing)/GDP/UDP-N,N'-diacetylbacillosamine 2-epimerase (hydrolysing)
MGAHTIRAAVLTTSRADWNALGMVAGCLANTGVETSVLAVAHPALDAVKADGFAPSIINVDPHASYGEKSGLIVSATEAWLSCRPGFHVAVILGDRWDALAVAMGASMAGVPIAHLSGGDRTVGSLDDRYRFAISALATYHFPSHNSAMARLIDSGVPGQNVFLYGSPGIDRTKRTTIFPARDVRDRLGLGTPHFVLANWQPETAKAEDPNAGLKAMIPALDVLPDDVSVVFVGPNDDTGADEATDLITRFCDSKRWLYVPNMPPALYLSALAHCELLIGNSSSGVYEAPEFGKFVIDVGLRQRGRPLDGARGMYTTEAIRDAITRGMRLEYEPPGRYFGDGSAAPKIASKIKELFTVE